VRSHAAVKRASAAGTKARPDHRGEHLKAAGAHQAADAGRQRQVHLGSGGQGAAVVTRHVCWVSLSRLVAWQGVIGEGCCVVAA
jgi:hypothetical protein